MIIRKHKPKPLVLNEKQKLDIVKLKKTEVLDEISSVEDSSMGLGDIVEKIAQPIAKAIDSVANTDIQNCGACKKRKEYLNKKFPLKK